MGQRHLMKLQMEYEAKVLAGNLKANAKAAAEKAGKGLSKATEEDKALALGQAGLAMEAERAAAEKAVRAAETENAGDVTHTIPVDV